MTGSVVEADERSLVFYDEAVDRSGRGEVESEAAARVPTEAAIGIGVDEEVDVSAVSVLPTRGEGGAATEAEVVLTAEGTAEGSANRLEEFVGTLRQA